MRDGELVWHARNNRAQLTEEERALWYHLRRGRLGARFRRQHPIGPYLADFACLFPRLVVEADGSQHIESDYDQERDAYMQARGWTVLRFTNIEINENLDGVLSTISETVDGLR